MLIFAFENHDPCLFSIQCEFVFTEPLFSSLQLNVCSSSLFPITIITVQVSGRSWEYICSMRSCVPPEGRCTVERFLASLLALVSLPNPLHFSERLSKFSWHEKSFLIKTCKIFRHIPMIVGYREACLLSLFLFFTFATSSPSKMFGARQDDVENVDEDQLVGFKLRLPGIGLKIRGLQVVFKLMMSKGGQDLLRLVSPANKRSKEKKLNLKKKTKNIRMTKNQIRLGVLRSLRFSK